MREMWDTMLRALGVQPERLRRPEDRDPALRLVQEQQARIREAVEDQRRRQWLDDQADLLDRGA